MDEVKGERAATEDAAGQQEAAGATRTEHALEALRSGWGDGYRIPAAEAAVTSRPRSALSLALGEPDQVRRLERFRAAHPGVIVLLKGHLPRAWADGRKIERQTLRDLLGDLPAGRRERLSASHAAGMPRTTIAGVRRRGRPCWRQQGACGS